MYLPIAFKQTDLAELHRQIAASRLTHQGKEPACPAHRS